MSIELLNNIEEDYSCNNYSKKTQKIFRDLNKKKNEVIEPKEKR
jgi:hypothetical protein